MQRYSRAWPLLKGPETQPPSHSHCAFCTPSFLSVLTIPDPAVLLGPTRPELVREQAEAAEQLIDLVRAYLR